MQVHSKRTHMHLLCPGPRLSPTRCTFRVTTIRTQMVEDRESLHPFPFRGEGIQNGGPRGREGERERRGKREREGEIKRERFKGLIKSGESHTQGTRVPPFPAIAPGDDQEMLVPVASVCLTRHYRRIWCPGNCVLLCSQPSPRAPVSSEGKRSLLHGD